MPSLRVKTRSVSNISDIIHYKYICCMFVYILSVLDKAIWLVPISAYQLLRLEN